MKLTFKNLLFSFTKNRIILIFVSALIINIINWVFLVMNVRPKIEPIPLHYNIYFGIDLIGQWYEMYVISLSGIIIILINLWLLKSLKKNEFFIKYVIASVTALAQIILLTGSIFIITQTGS